MIKKIGLLSLLSITFILFAFYPHHNNVFKVVIDVAHGGEDMGAVAKNHIEKEIVTKISRKIRHFNTNEEIEIYYTRENDNFVSLENRVKYINNLKPDLVISLHVNNNNNSKLSGMGYYISKQETPYSKKSREFAEALSKEFENKMKLKTTSIQKAPFYILNKSNCPAFLVELGYLSNPDDQKYLTDDESQINIARTILNFIQNSKDLTK